MWCIKVYPSERFPILAISRGTVCYLRFSITLTARIRWTRAWLGAACWVESMKSPCFALLPMNCSQSCSEKNSYHIDLLRADNQITWQDTGVRGLQWEWGCPALAFLRVAYKDGVSVLFCTQRLDVTPIWEQLPAAIGLWHFMAVHSSCLFAVGNDTEMNGTNQSELDEVWRDHEGYILSVGAQSSPLLLYHACTRFFSYICQLWNDNWTWHGFWMFFGIDRGDITAILYCSDWFVVLHDLTWSQIPIVQLGVQVWHLSWALRNHAKWWKVEGSLENRKRYSVWKCVAVLSKRNTSA